jgi:ABC-type bacteriocin/lantibiotic exporter with double-glycine peptidase domain
MKTFLKFLVILTSPIWLLFALLLVPIIVLFSVLLAIISLPFALIFAIVVLLIGIPTSLFLGVKFGRWKKEKEKVIISESKGEVSLKGKNYEVEILEGVEIGVLSVEVGKILNRGNVS